MAQLDASIILQGQPVNMLGVLDASNRMAGEQKDRLHQQGYRNMLATNGAGIMSGDQDALNALAGFDPTAALGVKNTRQEMDFSQQKMGILNAQERRQAEEYARGLSADQRAAEAKQIEDAVKMGMMIPDAATWDQTMAQMAPDLVGQFGNRQALASRFMEFSDVMKMAFPKPVDPTKGAPTNTYWNDPGNPAAGVTQIPGVVSDGGFRRASPEEAAQYGAAAGQFGPDGRFYPVNPPSGFSVETGPDGQLRVVQGPGAGSKPTTVGDVYNPGEVDAAIDLIDQIATDPALPGVTGSLEGGGGNDVDAFNVAQRAYYGDAGLGVITKINQLQSQTWLAARAMLKGGGPITDYESRKAEAAVARLSRAQGDAEFVAALKDLRDAITEGKAKLEAAKGGSVAPSAPSQPAAAPAGVDADLWDEMTPEERALFQ